MSNPTMYAVGGTVQASDGFYVARKADEELFEACQAMKFAYILTTRQVGKSSLMVRTAKRLQAEGTRCVLLDLSGIGVKNTTAEQWYFTVLTKIQSQLDLKTNAVEWWNNCDNITMSERLALFFQKVVLSEVQERVVIFIDEIDTTRALPFSDDFYTVIRSLFHRRVDAPEFRRLSFVLIGVATATDLIQDRLRTPFNIGEAIELTDFTLAEARPLADGLGPPTENAVAILERLLYWTAGHPFLTLRLCKAIAVEDRSIWSIPEVDQLVAQTFFGKRGDQDYNLQFVASMLTTRAPAGERERVLKTYREVLRDERPVRDEEPTLIRTHLKLSGVVRREEATLLMRNEIYKRVFDEKWIKEHLTFNWPEHLAKLAAGLIVVFLILSLPLGAYGWIKKGEAERAQQQLALTLNKVEEAYAVSEKNRLAADEARTRADYISSELAIEKTKVQTALDQETIARKVATNALVRAREQQQLAQRNAADLTKANNRERWNREGSVALEMSDYISAIAKFIEWLKPNDSKTSIENRTWVKYNLATAYRRVLDYEEAINSYHDALSDQQQVADNNSLQLIAIRHQLAEATREQGDYDAAENLFKELLSIIQLRAIPLGEQSEANIKGSIAGLYYIQGRDATTAATESNELAKRIEDRIDELNRLGDSPESNSRRTESQIGPNCLDRIVLEQKAKMLMRCQQELTDAEKLRADFQGRSRKKLQDAQSLYEEVVLVKERVLPFFSGELANAYDDLVKVYEAQAQPEITGNVDSSKLLQEKATKHSEIALVIRKNQLFELDKPAKKAKKIAAVAKKYEELNMKNQAAKMFVRLLDFKTTAPRVELLSASLSLVRIYYEDGQYAEGKPYFDQAMELFDPNEITIEDLESSDAFGLEFEDLLTLMLKEKRYGETSAFFERLGRIFEKSLQTSSSEDDSENASFLISIKTFVGSVQAADGKIAMAQLNFTQAIDLRNRYLPESPLDISPKFLSARLFLQQKQDSQAEPLFEYVRKVSFELLKLAAATEPLPDGLNIKRYQLYLDTIAGLALVHSRRGDSDKADVLYKELLTRTSLVIRSYAGKVTPRPNPNVPVDEDEILRGSLDSTLTEYDKSDKQTLQDHYVEYLQQAAEFYRSVKKTDEAARLTARAERVLQLIGGKKSSQLPWPF